MNESDLQRVKALTPRDLRKQKIRRTPANRAVIETMLELADEKFEVLISQSEVVLLTTIYERIRSAETFRNWRMLLDADPAIAYFWTLVKYVVAIDKPDERAQAWLKAYNEWDKYVARWPETSWNRALGAFIRQETMLVYGMRIMAQQKKPPTSWIH